LAGRALVGREKAKFTDAIWIVLIGTLFGAVFSAFFTGIIASVVQLVVWLALVKHFFDCGWLMAFVISIVAVVIFIVIAVLLGLLGFGIWTITTGTLTATV
jgi:predicted lysophospholipase L1 biosynthesis ABC-type transport system permease subunit